MEQYHHAPERRSRGRRILDQPGGRAHGRFVWELCAAYEGLDIDLASRAVSPWK